MWPARTPHSWWGLLWPGWTVSSVLRKRPLSLSLPSRSWWLWWQLWWWQRETGRKVVGRTGMLTHKVPHLKKKSFITHVHFLPYLLLVQKKKAANINLLRLMKTDFGPAAFPPAVGQYCLRFLSHFQNQNRQQVRPSLVHFFTRSPLQGSLRKTECHWGQIVRLDVATISLLIKYVHVLKAVWWGFRTKHPPLLQESK